MNRVSSQFMSWLKHTHGMVAEMTSGLHEKTLGTWTKPRCSLKGAETNYYLEYLVTVVLPELGHCLGEAAVGFTRAGNDLLRLLRLIREHTVRFTAPAIQEFYDSTRTYLVWMQGVLNAKPKDHMLVHLANRLAFMGSPALYGNWLDESVNQTLKAVAAGAHGAVAYTRIMNDFPLAMHAKRGLKRGGASSTLR